jgi:hypothetical protein
MHPHSVQDKQIITEGHVFLALLGIVVLAGIVAGIIHYNPLITHAPISISDFVSCVAAGNPVIESYPRQCATRNGRVFVESVSVTSPVSDSNITTIPTRDAGNLGTDTAAGSNICVVAGCSRQLCVEPNQTDIITICVYLPAYACYTRASCERQTNGLCGWTQTLDLIACLRNASTESISPVGDIL